MVFARRRAAVTAIATAAIPAALLAVTLAPRAQADEKAPSAERIRSAADEFDMGRRAFVARAYAEAAVHFENAYTDAPRAEALRNAIRARRAANEPARAATLASLAAVRYATDTVTMTLANETLAELSPRLYGVNLSCEPKCGVAADGRVVSLEDAKQIAFYLEPGKHELLVSWSGDRTKRVPLTATAGGEQELHVDAPRAPASQMTAPFVSIVPSTTPSSADAAASKARKPFGPAVFVTGLALTAVGAAATIVSGLDAQSHPGKDAVLRDCVGQGESCPTYQEGKSAELRTNVLLGATAGVAVVTTVIGVFFTQWHSAPKTAAGAPPRARTLTVAPLLGGNGGGAALQGTF